MNKTPVIEVNQLSFRYQEQNVLQNVQFSLSQGEYTALIGPNGSGKSTLLKLILGLLPVQEGYVNLFDRSISDKSIRKNIGYVSQKANHFQSDFPATVREVIASGLYGELGLFRRMGRRQHESVNQAIEQVDLQKFADENVARLSGGQQQRVFIARALVNNPALVILDEPTVGVDVQVKEQFYQLLRELHRENQLSILLVTHDLTDVLEHVDHILCLNKQLIFDGTRDAFIEQQAQILPPLFGVKMGVSS